MKEVVVRMTGDHIKVKDGEYVQDLIRCGECAKFNNGICKLFDWYTEEKAFCSNGEKHE